MAQLILIGGPTGIGKSTFIDILISSDNRFHRPQSYTTRPPRAQEIRSEYCFVSVEEFERLNSTGAFVTVDEVYGYHYAITYTSIAEIVRAGGIAIKEVHPSNHSKLKRLLPDVISVLILPDNAEQFWLDIGQNKMNLSSNRILRIKKDQEFYASIVASLDLFDIVLRIKPSAVHSGVAEFFSKLSKFTEIHEDTTYAIEKRNVT